MHAALPMFPLGAVLFPGMQLPLHVFEDRYRSLVKHLLELPEQQRNFGIVAIREGYEVGSHGMQSAHRVGCEARLAAARSHSDGRYDIGVIGRRRLRLLEMDTSGPYLLGQVEYLDELEGPDPSLATERALEVFAAYRAALGQAHGDVSGSDHSYQVMPLSYSLAGAVALTLRERQELLECESASARLMLLSSMLVDELAAMRAVPSLPATELSRTAWSPN